MSLLPTSHVRDALDLEGDGYHELFKIQLLPTGLIAFTGGQGVTWQGVTYDGIACQISGTGKFATEQQSRPKLEVENPDGAYSLLVAQGSLEGAMLTRYRVLRDDLLNNRNIFVSHTWKIARVAALTRVRVSIELRELGDGPNFMIPAQTFSPPRFPVVNLR